MTPQQPTSTKVRKPPYPARELFHVTKSIVVGSVTLGDDGDRTPTEAALALIAKDVDHSDDYREYREYRFPGPGAGETVRVSIGVEQVQD